MNSQVLIKKDNRYNNLTAIRFSNIDANLQILWDFKCDCGEIVTYSINDVKSGNAQSCGCLSGNPTLIKRLTSKPEYNVWSQMKGRCYNKRNRNYHNYGGRGRVVCDEWLHSFETFYRDMGPRPSPKHVLRRLDQSLGFSKDNCEWSLWANVHRNNSLKNNTSR